MDIKYIILHYYLPSCKDTSIPLFVTLSELLCWQRSVDKGLSKLWFSSGQVWMWEVDHKEGWVPKKWCCQIVVLEKALENSLDRKEIKPINPEENQSWILIGRTNAEAPILWPPDAKNWLIGKDLDAGKGWRQEEKAEGWDGWLASLTQWTWVWVNSRSWWWTGRPGVLQSMGSQSWTRLSNWTELNLQLVGSQFPNQGLNAGPSSENRES